jgi:hypothetical protein
VFVKLKKKNMGSLTDEFRSFQEELNNLKRLVELDDAKDDERIREFEGMNMRQRSENEVLRREIEESKEKIRQLEADKRENDERIKENAQRILDLEKEKNTLTEDSGQLENEILEKGENIERLEHENNIKDATIDSLTDRIGKLHQRIEDLDKLVEDLAPDIAVPDIPDDVVVGVPDYLAPSPPPETGQNIPAPPSPPPAPPAPDTDDDDNDEPSIPPPPPVANPPQQKPKTRETKKPRDFTEDEIEKYAKNEDEFFNTLEWRFLTDDADVETVVKIARKAGITALPALWKKYPTAEAIPLGMVGPITAIFRRQAVEGDPAERDDSDPDWVDDPAWADDPDWDDDPDRTAGGEYREEIYRRFKNLDRLQDEFLVKLHEIESLPLSLPGEDVLLPAPIESLSSDIGDVPLPPSLDTSYQDDRRYEMAKLFFGSEIQDSLDFFYQFLPDEP